jgi:hypothetical protein
VYKRASIFILKKAISKAILLIYTEYEERFAPDQEESSAGDYIMALTSFTVCGKMQTNHIQELPRRRELIITNCTGCLYMFCKFTETNTLA